MNGIGPVMNLLILDVNGTYDYQYNMIDKSIRKLETDVFQNVRAVRFCQNGSIMYAKENHMYRFDPNTMENTVIGNLDGVHIFWKNDDFRLLCERGKWARGTYGLSGRWNLLSVYLPFWKQDVVNCGL